MEELHILDLFVKYSSLDYFKYYIEEDLDYLRNFDLDIKDIKKISERIKEVQLIISFIREKRGLK